MRNCHHDVVSAAEMLGFGEPEQLGTPPTGAMDGDEQPSTVRHYPSKVPVASLLASAPTSCLLGAVGFDLRSYEDLSGQHLSRRSYFPIVMALRRHEGPADPEESTSPSLVIVGGKVDSPVAEHSGYQSVIPHLRSSTRVTVLPLSQYRPPLVPGRIWSRVASSTGVKWYHSEALSLEADAARLMLRARGALYHTLYGEDHYRYLGYASKLIGRSRSRVIATFHQPPAVFSQAYRANEAIAQLDAAIVVAGVQAESLTTLMPSERVFVIPHGVDTNFFSPASRKGSVTNSCLFVGDWLRDFDTLRWFAKEMSTRRPELIINVVTPASNLQRLGDLPNVKALPRLSDPQLREAYQSATMLLLPLLDATANNSLLEGLSCGLPAVVSDVGGVRDYVDGTCAILVGRDDRDQFVRAAESLLDDPSLRQRLSRSARERALELDWSVIARRLMAVYEETRRRPPGGRGGSSSQQLRAMA